MAQQIRNLVSELLIWLTMMTIWAWSQPMICPVIYHNLEFSSRIFTDSISFWCQSPIQNLPICKWVCVGMTLRILPLRQFYSPEAPVKAHRRRCASHWRRGRPRGKSIALPFVFPLLLLRYTFGHKHLSYPRVCSHVQPEGGVRVRTRAQMTTTFTPAFFRPTLSLLHYYRP